MHKELQALIAQAKGQTDQAITLLKEAAQIEESMRPPNGAADPHQAVARAARRGAAAGGQGEGGRRRIRDQPVANAEPRAFVDGRDQGARAAGNKARAAERLATLNSFWKGKPFAGTDALTRVKTPPQPAADRGRIEGYGRDKIRACDLQSQIMPPRSHSSALVIRGARTHNLKNVDLTLPAGQLIVFTGVSGSGKSSLAFDTIYAEGQRRYVESLSAYARQFLERMEKPDVDRIDGICPSIAIRQKNSVRNPRSTVGTVTEIHDYMRLLFARVGRTICRKCGQEVIRETAEVVTSRLLALPEGTRLLLGFDLPIVTASQAREPATMTPKTMSGPERVAVRGRVAVGSGARESAPQGVRPAAGERPGGRVRRGRCGRAERR